MEDRVSVIIPAYNVDKYVDRCLKSISEQTHQNIEIIIINDGSTDFTPDIISEHTKQDNRIIAVNTKNNGLSATRNIGLELSSGSYVSFVDADDYIEKDMIENLLLNLKEQNCDISTCNYSKIYTDGHIEPNVYLKKPYQQHNTTCYLYDLLSLGDNYVWNKLFRRELFDNIKFPTGQYYEDISIMYKLFIKARNIRYVNYYGYNYYIRGDSITNENFNLRKLDMAIAQYNRYIEIKTLYPILEYIAKKCLFNCIVFIINELKGRNMREYILIDRRIKDLYERIYNVDFDNLQICSEEKKCVKNFLYEVIS